MVWLGFNPRVPPRLLPSEGKVTESPAEKARKKDAKNAQAKPLTY
jgi:hypothetical protein